MVNLTEVINTWNHVSPEVRQLAEIFASAEGIGRRYVLGRNEHSAALSEIIEIDAFVDDFSKPGSVWNGKPVKRSADVPSAAIVVNCSMSISPVSAARKLAGLNIAGVLAFSDLCKVFPDRIVLPNFVMQTRRDLEQNLPKWEQLWKSLEDAQSRRVLDDLLIFRITGDYTIMSPYSVRLRDQYFEDFLGLKAGEVFEDAGGFDGDTTEEFCKRCPDYRKVFLFEPSGKNILTARNRLQRLRSVEFIEQGLSDAIGTLAFDQDAGSASAISESGACQIRVTTLDAAVQEKVSFIKMDLEGWEPNALKGAERHILNDHPKLAIAVYHHPSDFWRLMEFVLNVRSDYKVYLRHYTEGWSETVMYFVPILASIDQRNLATPPLPTP
jgi:FkbM family methyltransferase